MTPGSNETTRPASVVDDVGNRAVLVPSVPQRRREDDGVLQPLARVDGRQCHGLRVGVETHEARVGGDLGIRGALLLHPRDERRDAAAGRELTLRQQLRAVLDVGDVAFAADAGEEAFEHAVRSQRIHDGGDAALVELRRERVDEFGGFVGVGRLECVDAGDVPADEGRQARRSHALRAMGLFEGEQELEPPGPGAAAQYGVATHHHGGDAGGTQLLADLEQLCVGAREDRHVVRRERRVAERRPARQQLAGAHREVVRDGAARASCGQRVTVDPAHLDRRGVADEAGRLAVGGDGVARRCRARASRCP